MRKGIANGVLVTVAEMYRIYGADTTQWPEVNCQGCGKHVHPYGIGHVATEIVGRRPPNARVPHASPQAFHHYDHEGKGCRYAMGDIVTLDKLKRLPPDPEAAAKLKAECLSETSIIHTKKVLRRIFGSRNYSDDLVETLEQATTRMGAWNWQFPAWAYPYIAVQLTSFVYKFRDSTKVVRFSPDSKSQGILFGEGQLIMVFNKGGNPVKGFAPIPVSENPDGRPEGHPGGGYKPYGRNW
mgnify:CR=1 FL=1